jgi:putative RNA 2'-phosphotransferase
MNLTKVSVFLSLILRHKPETIGITLDKHGWANVDELIQGVSKKYPIDMDILEEIVRTDEKQRYSFNENKTLIRANQGHSVIVDLGLESVQPPKCLYHGTGKKYFESINKNGLIHKSRQYVHLSSDLITAVSVGERHGIPIIYVIDSDKMYRDGFLFFKSENDVWLTDRVPAEYFIRTIGAGHGDIRPCDWEK